MDRVFTFTVAALLFGYLCRKLFEQKLRRVYLTGITIYLVTLFTLYKSYTVMPLIATIFPVLAILNVLVMVFQLGIGTPFKQKPERYMILFYVFLAIYILSSLWGNYPLFLLVKKTTSIVYILSGIVVGRTITSFSGELGFLKNCIVYGLPTLIILMWVVAPQLSFEVGEWSQVGDVELLNPNTFGLLVVPYVCIASLGVVLHRKAWLKTMGWVMLAISGYLLVKIGSRTSFLAALVPLFFVFMTFIRDKLLRSVMVVGLIAAFVFMALHNNFGERFRVFHYVSNESLDLSQRDLIWDEGVSSMTGIERVIGTGGKITGMQEFGVLPGLEGWHSALVEIYYTTGVVGTLFFVAAMVLFFLRAYALGRRGIMALSFVLAGLLTAIGEAVLLRGHWLVAIFFGIGMGLISSRLPPPHIEITVPRRAAGPHARLTQ